jgi:hypothetical protein
MRVTLPKMFIVGLAGPGANARWRTVPNGQVDLQAAPYKVSKDRPIRHSPRNPLLIHPANAKAECDAWTACDSYYTAHRDLLAAHWKGYWQGTPTSTYDRWMKYAIPRSLRGMLCPAAWDPAVTPMYPTVWRTFAPEQIPGYTPDRVVPVPESCNVHGCHYACARLYHLTTREPPYWQMWAAYVYVEAADVAADNNDRCWVNMYALTEYAPPPHTLWRGQPVWVQGYYNPVLYSDKPILGVIAQVTQPMRDANNRLPPSPTYDLARVVTIYYLDSNNTYTHWPRVPNTHRGWSRHPELHDYHWPEGITLYWDVQLY